SASGNFGSWGFDLSGADLNTRPGDDFFRHCNGTWFDRAVIAPDRQATGVDVVLAEKAEEQIREILEQGEQGVEAAARAELVNTHASYQGYRDEGRIESPAAPPIAATLQGFRPANSRFDLAVLMGSANDPLCSSIFGVGITIASKAPSRYAVQLGQAGL